VILRHTLCGRAFVHSREQLVWQGDVDQGHGALDAFNVSRYVRDDRFMGFGGRPRCDQPSHAIRVLYRPSEQRRDERATARRAQIVPVVEASAIGSSVRAALRFGKRPYDEAAQLAASNGMTLGLSGTGSGRNLLSTVAGSTLRSVRPAVSTRRREPLGRDRTDKRAGDGALESPRGFARTATEREGVQVTVNRDKRVGLPFGKQPETATASWAR